MLTFLHSTVSVYQNIDAFATNHTFCYSYYNSKLLSIEHITKWAVIRIAHVHIAITQFVD